MNLHEATRNYQVELERARAHDDGTILDDEELELMYTDLSRAKNAMVLAWLKATVR